MWVWCDEELWLQDVLLAETTLDFKTEQAKHRFIEVLENHADVWRETMNDVTAVLERRAEAHAGMSLLRRLVS
jgi:hypothetical protein